MIPDPSPGTIWEPATPEAQAAADDVFGERRGSRRVTQMFGDATSTLLYQHEGPDVVTEDGYLLEAGRRYELCLTTGVFYAPPFSAAALAEMLFPDSWSILVPF